MSGRNNPSARVVIMDDISWSEPVPRGRSRAAELDTPSWMRSETIEPAQPAVREFVDEYRSGSGRGWNADFAEFVDEPEVLDYVEADDEQVWGPRPKLLSTEPGGRRTVVITGRGADRHVAPRAADRGGAPTHARHGFQADRTAMWAVLLCVIVLLAAVASH